MVKLSGQKVIISWGKLITEEKLQISLPAVEMQIKVSNNKWQKESKQQENLHQLIAGLVLSIHVLDVCVFGGKAAI